MNADGSTVDWFHVGVIAPPRYDPPGFEAHVTAKLAKLLGPKSRTHKIGIFFPWAEPVGHAVNGTAAANGWHSAVHAVDRMSGDTGWIRCWLQLWRHRKRLWCSARRRGRWKWSWSCVSESDAESGWRISLVPPIAEEVERRRSELD